MPLTCKWATQCSNCAEPIEEGADLWLVKQWPLENRKLCYWCARLEGRACECGNDKKPDHWTCWDCKKEQDQRDGKVCACGAWKKPQYATCWSCKNKPQEEEA